ncbi:hypothetical protein JZX87_13830 [Agrobacterium sp. Ap1]|uniref:hypothetical protein n=1 Tax=Agrobacterium sp. Ap1 TaxID=2815337 RepID=UPI001A8D22DB|nr:hypothetical protein [Agrobacterium sp. Ap1]MBO0142242.1 hypothetical protein [Agrobacterium sp. Ap1]
MSEAIVVAISSGTASRYIKPAWLGEAGDIQPIAFDLRDCAPPETYVSFFLTQGNDEEEHFEVAFALIRRRIRIKSGAVILMDIAECLEEVNDEDQPIISFRDQKLPHCGLFYHTPDLTKITEAKTTLCFLARERIRHAPSNDDGANLVCEISGQ